jgi:ABC-2 type transport system permease protein
MNMATAIALQAQPLPQPLSKTLAVCLKEGKYEFLKNLRLRAYSLSVILFPVMFYILFGLVLNREEMINGTRFTTYLIATYGTFGVMGASLFGTAAGLAVERGLGWLQVKRASPMPPVAYFFGKVMMAVIFSTTVILALLALGIAFGGVRLSLLEGLQLVSTLIAGSLPFCAMGLAIGYFAGPNSATGVINLIYFPMSFLSGLWVPLKFLPKVLQALAHVLPPYHLAQIALSAVGAGQHESNLPHWGYLFGFSLICLGIARIGFQRDEGKMYG